MSEMILFLVFHMPLPDIALPALLTHCQDKS